MRVLFIHNRYQFKGGEDTTVAMEKALLDARGHETELLLFDNDNIQSFGQQVSAGVKAFYNGASAKAVKEKVISFRPDIIHVHNHFFTASPAIFFAAKKLDVPVVMTIQNFRMVCANALFLRDGKVCELCRDKLFGVDGIRYKCYRNSALQSALVTGVTGLHKALGTWRNKVDAIITPSEFLRDRLTDSSFKTKPGQIIVKPNFVEDNGYVNRPRGDYFLYIGRISKEKGIDILLSYFLNHPEKKLVIAGDGPEKEWLIDKIKDKSWIEFRGMLEKEAVKELMSEALALLFTSIWYEGLPLTIIEALSVGTPVIASRLGAMPEMIVHGRSGFLFNPGDADDLGAAMGEFDKVTDKAELNMGARNRFLEKYSSETHYESILKIYGNLIESKIAMT